MSAELNVTVTELCALPPGCGADAITSDGHVIAFCQEPDGRLRFRWDGSAGEPFDGLAELRDKRPAVYSSEDGAHVAYVGLRGEKIFVGRDDGEDPPFDGFSRSVPPTFGGGGLHLAYGAMVADGAYQLIVDGEPVGSPTLAPIAAVFSADGARLAYMEMRSDSLGKPECRIILDGQAGEWFAGTRNASGAMQFSPDGHHFAYYAIDGDLHARWVVDGVPQRLFNEVPSISLARLRRIGVLEPAMPACFSPDSQRFAYFADVVEKGVAIVEDDVAGPLFKAVRHPIFSPDSLNLAYGAETYSKTVALVVDGAITGEWPATHSSDPVFSPDSRRIAFELQREERRLLSKRDHFAVAVDGQTYPELLADDASYYPQFSSDGARLAWWLRRGNDCVLVVNGVVQEGTPPVEGELRFDAQDRVVHLGRLGSSHSVIIDGVPGPLADDILILRPAKEVFSHQPSDTPVAFRLSPDGAHVAWAGVFGEDARPVFDDEVGPAFDSIDECRFADDGTAAWWAQRGDVVLRVDRPSA